MYTDEQENWITKGGYGCRVGDIDRYTKLPSHDEVMAMYPNDYVIKITDDRDIIELERRRKANMFQPSIDELYSVNPDFNGIYED